MNEQKMRDEFEVDAEPYGFDVTRSACDCGYCFYENEHTNNRWHGFVAAKHQDAERIAELEAKLLAAHAKSLVAKAMGVDEREASCKLADAYIKEYGSR